MSNSTQNDEIEVDGETYVKWDTQNDWEKRFYDKFPCLMHFRPNKRSYGYSEVGDDVKEFIAKELADARRKVIAETIKKIEGMKTMTPFEVKESDMPYHIGVRNKAIDDVLATLRKEKS